MSKSGKNGREKNNTPHYQFRQHQPPMPDRLALPKGKRLIQVFVEGYEDVAFWRGIFDDFESERFTFEISVPLREDLAKGKKIVLNTAARNKDPYTLYCVDSDFDYLFADQTPQARVMTGSPNIFHTYAYATENFLCYAPSLHNICVKATKNDMRIFDFERFLQSYSHAIFPLFVWYAYSAQINAEKMFTLLDFRSSVKINYLETEDNGSQTIGWLHRQVDKRLKILRGRYPDVERHFPAFIRQLRSRGVNENNTYLFMQGHTLMDNVVMPVLDAVCDKLRYMCVSRIAHSERKGIALHNEQSNYNNAVQDVRDAMLFNENYKDCFLYRKVRKDIQTYLNSLQED